MLMRCTGKLFFFPPPMPGPTKRTGRRVAKTATKVADRRWVGQLARWSFFAIGIVYLLVGVLAVMGLAGFSSGQFTGARGAGQALQAQPYGWVMYLILTLGLAVYVSWRFSQAVLDVEGRGRDFPGLLRRLGLLLSCLSYAGLAVEALRRLILIGWFFLFAAWRSNPESTRGLGGALQYLGQQPYGRWMIGIVAFGLFAYGIFMLSKVPYRRISPRLAQTEEET